MSTRSAQASALRILRDNKRVPVAGAIFVSEPDAGTGLQRYGLMVPKCPICGNPHTHLASPDPVTARATLSLGRFRCPEGTAGFDVYIIQEIPPSILKHGGFVSRGHLQNPPPAKCNKGNVPTG